MITNTILNKISYVVSLAYEFKDADVLVVNMEAVGFLYVIKKYI